MHRREKKEGRGGKRSNWENGRKERPWGAVGGPPQLSPFWALPQPSPPLTLAGRGTFTDETIKTHGYSILPTATQPISGRAGTELVGQAPDWGSYLHPYGDPPPLPCKFPQPGSGQVPASTRQQETLP